MIGVLLDHLICSLPEPCLLVDMWQIVVPHRLIACISILKVMSWVAWLTQDVEAQDNSSELRALYG